MLRQYRIIQRWDGFIVQSRLRLFWENLKHDNGGWYGGTNVVVSVYNSQDEAMVRIVQDIVSLIDARQQALKRKVPNKLVYTAAVDVNILASKNTTTADVCDLLKVDPQLVIKALTPEKDLPTATAPTAVATVETEAKS